MSDIRYNNEFCIVRENGTNEIVLNELLSARVETLQQVDKHATLNNVPASYFPDLPAAGWIETGMYNYKGKTVMCIQPHNRTIYTPEETPALFFAERPDYSNWVQPTGAHDAYMKGDKVKFKGNNYESVINANVWSPAVYRAGWKLL